jgi:ABC-type thiamin/hydroxymethylpyrimidine transport system permease subunit
MNRIVVLILTAVFGLFFLAFGVYGTVVEFRSPPLHTVHLAFFLFFILFGAVLMPGVGTVIFAKLRDSAELARDVAPTFGRRASQGEIALAPPAAEKPKPDVMPGEGGPT